MKTIDLINHAFFFSLPTFKFLKSIFSITIRFQSRGKGGGGIKVNEKREENEVKRKRLLKSKKKKKKRGRKKFGTKTDFHWLILNTYPEEASNYIYTKKLWNLAMCNPRAGQTRNRTFFFFPRTDGATIERYPPKAHKGRSKLIGINTCIRKGQSRAVLAFGNKKTPHIGNLLLGKIWSKWLELWQWTLSIPQGSIPPFSAAFDHHIRQCSTSLQAYQGGSRATSSSDSTFTLCPRSMSTSLW